jgi:hypothetical protein
MAFTGFKTSKPRQFNYKPLFYNKQEEEFEQKLKKVREGSEDAGTGDLRQKMEQSWKRRRNSSSSRNSSIRKLAIAIALVFLLLYLIFFL